MLKLSGPTTIFLIDDVQMEVGRGLDKAIERNWLQLEATFDIDSTHQERVSGFAVDERFQPLSGPLSGRLNAWTFK